MGHKEHPIGVRLGVTANWISQWFDRKRYREYLVQDQKIRTFLHRILRQAALDGVGIERTPKEVRITIRTARPGLVIGRGGDSVEQLKRRLMRDVFGANTKGRVTIAIEEIRKPDSHARVVARNVADQLERRVPFRRVIRQALEKVMQQVEVQGAKIQVSGRLNGAVMSRREWVSDGRLPLQTLRANIDYALEEARTTYGVIGVKVWLYKGEIFEEDER